MEDNKVQKTDITLDRINGLNRLLSEVYKNNKRVSDILTEEGFSKSELLEMIPLLGLFIDKVLLLFADRYKERHDCERLADIIIKRYALTDGNELTLENIGILYGVSRERIRRLQVKGEKRIKAYLRKIIIDSACLVLGKQADVKMELKFNMDGKVYLTRVMNSLGLSNEFPWVKSTQVANELYKSGYLEARVHAGRLQFFPGEKGIEIGLRSVASEKNSKVVLEQKGQEFIVEFVREKFGL